MNTITTNTFFHDELSRENLRTTQKSKLSCKRMPCSGCEAFLRVSFVMIGIVTPTSSRLTGARPAAWAAKRIKTAARITIMSIFAHVRKPPLLPRPKTTFPCQELSGALSVTFAAVCIDWFSGIASVLIADLPPSFRVQQSAADRPTN